MNVIIQPESSEEGIDGESNELQGSIQIHTQAFVNIGVADEQGVDKSIAEKESEVLSLIILNNQDGTVSNVEIDGHLEENQVAGVVEDENIKIQAEEHLMESDVPIEPNSELIQDQLPGAEFVGETMITMEFHAADAAWITLLDRFELLVNDNRIRGYVEGEKQFLCLWESFQTSTMSTFSVRSSDKFYKVVDEGEEGAVNGRLLKGAPKWSRTPIVPFDGVPFVSVERKYFGCRFVCFFACYCLLRIYFIHLTLDCISCLDLLLYMHEKNFVLPYR